MKISGKIIEIFDTVAVSEKFKRRAFVLEFAKNPKYPEVVQFELNQDKCKLIDGISIGDEVEVEFDVSGRKWVDPKGVAKYFNTLKAWKIQRLGGAQSNSPSDKTANSNETEEAYPF